MTPRHSQRAPQPPPRAARLRLPHLASALLLLLLSSLALVHGRELHEQAAGDVLWGAEAAVTANATRRHLLAPLASTRIVGGTTATPGRFPYTASLRDAGLNHFCGGKSSPRETMLAEQEGRGVMGASTRMLLTTRPLAPRCPAQAR